MKKSLYLFIALCTLFTSCSQKESRPNVILLTLDTLRADALGCYGNEIVKTPTLDGLAAEGVLFEDAICQIPATLTSHTAIMTGLYPKTTGVRFRTATVPENEETLAKVFSKRGYRTAAFISSLVLAPEHGLDQGFDVYDLGSMVEGKIKKPERRAEETLSQALSYLQKNKDNAFFIWIHLYDAHTPYDAPAPYGSMYDQGYDGELNGSVSQITRLNASQGEGANERDLQHLQALYWGEVSYMDAQIGRLLDHLKQENLYEKTIIAAISDHGENLGEKGNFFHGDTLYNTEIKIPFILRVPNTTNQGRRVSSLVQSIDLFPTLINLAGVKNEKFYVEGQDLTPLLNDSNDTFAEKPGFMETEADMVSEANKTFGMRTDEYKYIHNEAHRREEIPLGLFTEIPLQGPAIVLMRIKGDPSIRLMAHIRYRTQQLYRSRDFRTLAELNTTVVHAESFGTDPLHRQAQSQQSFLPTPDGWRIQATPDLYRIAKEYGDAQGWPTEWMVLEGVGVDASLPNARLEGEFTVDQFELYAPTQQFPSHPRYRAPFWVIEDFEGATPRALVDAQQGPTHETSFIWNEENLFNGYRQQTVRIQFIDDPTRVINELYAVRQDPKEERNLLLPDYQISNASSAEEIARSAGTLIENWRTQQAGVTNVLEMNTEQREALEALGYTQ